MTPTKPPRDLRQRESDELRCVLLTANSKYQVLPATVHVRHRSAGRSRLEIGRPQALARRLVERAELIPAETGRRADVDLIADGRKEQRLGCDHRGARRVTERPEFEMRDCGMIARTIAVRSRPHFSPRFRSRAVIRPSGGFTSGKPRGADDPSVIRDSISQVR